MHGQDTILICSGRATQEISHAIALALAVTFTTAATASDLLLYLDFEQTPPRHPFYLAADPLPAFTFSPLELNALERSLAGNDDDPEAPGFEFDPLDLNALQRS